MAEKQLFWIVMQNGRKMTISDIDYRNEAYGKLEMTQEEFDDLPEFEGF